MLLSLPHAWRSRTVVGAASDRFYRKRGFAIASGFWINTFPFDRGGGQRRGLAAAAAHLRDGRNVLLFPQGTRGAGPEGYRAGVAELALTAGAPIIPIHIEGTALVMPKGRGLTLAWRLASLRVLRPEGSHSRAREGLDVQIRVRGTPPGASSPAPTPTRRERAPRKWRTVSAGADPWAERGVERPDLAALSRAPRCCARSPSRRCSSPRRARSRCPRSSARRT